MEMTFIQLLVKRIQSKSPAFYKKIRLMAIIIVGLCGSVLYALSRDSYGLDPNLVNKVQWYADHIGAFLSGVFVLTYTGSSDPKLVGPPADPTTDTKAP